MNEADITNLSSRGQIVIPQGIRKKLKLEEGDKFIVTSEEDTILLKKLDFKDFDKLLKKTREFVKKRNITPEDLKVAIKNVRDAESRNRH